MNPSQAHLTRLIEKAGGWLSFEQFMSAALYHPDYGYYTRGIREVGSRGDFTTSPTGNHLLGRALAEWIKHEKPRLNLGTKWHLIEIGGGNGDLARSVLQSLGFFGRLGLTYHLVEISAPLRQKQMDMLRGWRVVWHDSVSEALHAAEGVALLFSNELVDAFPCRRLQRSGDSWQELGLTCNEDGIQEIRRPLDVGEDLKSTALDLDQRPSQIIEVHHAYREELHKLSICLKKGIMLTIDYGARFPELYHRRPEGTLRGYFHHQRVCGKELYMRIGQQDLTADVNFSDLEKWGNEAGLENESMETQRDFVLGRLGKVDPKNTSEARLLDSVGAGCAFKVLQQSKGLAMGLSPIPACRTRAKMFF